MVLDWVLLGFRILSTAVLYTFLGIAFYIIWRDLKAVDSQPAVQAQTVSQLRVLLADQDDRLSVGDTLPLQPVTYLGRDPENTIVLTDVSASGRHARISRESGVWWLEDLGSKNGTTLNELPVSKPTSLMNQDLIGIGNLRFKFELG